MGPVKNADQHQTQEVGVDRGGHADARWTAADPGARAARWSTGLTVFSQSQVETTVVVPAIWLSLA